ncbi:glutathione S-transferase [Photobacterium sanguinicancri]|uniref:glutathione S-transferase n=1 Tax=Photobacterium sanguinicancri TaxID=875932 RepID=UPI000788627F|nr:glutathione S-transferase [Photobacterium sanguinicancri]
MSDINYPILYSLQRCPYAIRARLSLLLANQTVLLRNVKLQNKPAEMLAVSPKGTVPVLYFPQEDKVIDQSLAIMYWALTTNDPNNLLRTGEPKTSNEMRQLIEQHDNVFIPQLEQYRATARYHDKKEADARQICEGFVAALEDKLTHSAFLMGNTPSLADYALLPFMRQFSKVDRKWFQLAPYPKFRQWLTNHYNNPLYAKAMRPYPEWLVERQNVILSFES